MSDDGKIHLGVSKEQLLKLIENSSWDRYSLVAWSGTTPEIISSERNQRQIEERWYQAFPAVQLSTAIITEESGEVDLTKPS